MKVYDITSSSNSTFKVLKSLLTSQGIGDNKEALIFGRKAVTHILKTQPKSCLGLVAEHEMSDKQERDAAVDGELTFYRLHSELFRTLDVFGTRSPILVVRPPDFSPWAPQEVDGAELIVPFQDPANVGAVIRSAVAFGINRIVLAPGSAHPFHPKSTRAASGAVFSVSFFKLLAYDDIHRARTKVVALDMHGEDVANFAFPSRFTILPGVEGPGVPKDVEATRVTIPIDARIESLNAMAATTVLLFQWAQQRASMGAVRH